jgi:hypothetical protein
MFRLIFTSCKTLIKLIFLAMERGIFIYVYEIAKVGEIYEFPLLLLLYYSIILAPLPRLQSKHKLCKLSI